MREGSRRVRTVPGMATLNLSSIVADVAARVSAAVTPPTLSNYNPQPKQKQATLLALTCYETLYGGAAGGGKSYWIRHDSVLFCLQHPGAHVGIVRRTMPMLKQTHLGPLRTICRDLADHNRTESTWTFPNGSVLRLISLQHDGDEQNYKSVEFDRLYFDEVTELLESQYTYMLSRLRSSYAGHCQACGQHGHKVGAIAVSNPEGVGYAWVKRRWVKPKPGDLTTGQTMPEPYTPWKPPLPDGSGLGRSRVFVPATILDNPALLAANPEYELQLRSIPDPRKRKALLDGDWDAMDQVPGALWSLSNIDANRVNSTPDFARVAVAIDPAGTSGPYSDETGIIAAALDRRGQGYVLADRSGKYGPAEWARVAIELYTEIGADAIVIEKNAGAGSESLLRNLQIEAAAMQREGLLGVTPPIIPVVASVAKRTRANPIAGLYLRNIVHHVSTFDDLEEQMTTWTPESPHSPDRVDALVWALTYLVTLTKPKTGVRYNK